MSKGPTITPHAADRASQRLSMREEVLSKTMEKVLSDGLRLADVKGNLRRYLFGMQGRHHSTCIVYAEHVYAMHGDKLITVFPLPRNLKKLAAVFAAKRTNQTNP
jgi:hypothetical protein